jgi:hypothetical protein
VSWRLHAMTLHDFEQDATAWVTDQAVRVHDCAGGQAAAPPGYPTVAEVLRAFRRAGCHGTAWYQLADADEAPELALAPCPGPSACQAGGSWDVGEVTLHPPGPRAASAGAGELSLTTPVAVIGFRKPSGRAVLRTLCELASTSVPLVAFDDGADEFFVVRPTTGPRDAARVWPWS